MIFDKKTVQEKQELSKLFGEVAYEQVHILATNEKAAAQKKYDDAKKKGASPTELKSLQANVDAWGESGIYKIALHATVGGLMSEMGGSGFASGTVGAGINEAAQKVLSNIKDPGLHQIASALLGAAAAKVAGGNAQAGASTAASGTKNNLLAYYLTDTKDALKQALQAKDGTEPSAQQMADLNAQITGTLNTVYPDGHPTVEGEAVVIRSVLQANGIPSANIDEFINVYTAQAPMAVQQYNSNQMSLSNIRSNALANSIADNIKGTVDLVYLATPEGQKQLTQALLKDPTLPMTIGQEAYNSLRNWANNIQGNNGDEAQAKAQGQLLGQVLTTYVTTKGIDAYKKLGVAAEEFQLPEVVVTADRIPRKRQTGTFPIRHNLAAVEEAVNSIVGAKRADMVFWLLGLVL